jgi:hypothetical protein
MGDEKAPQANMTYAIIAQLRDLKTDEWGTDRRDS